MMNERIQKLAKQAGFVTWSDEEWKPEGAVIDWASDYDKELEKFAELIIEECVVIMSREIDEVENSVERNRTISEMMDLLEQHFGVE